MNQPEAWRARTLPQLSERLTARVDVVEFLMSVSERAAELVGAAEVGILLAAQGEMLTAVASVSDRVRITELLELQNREGPGLACYRSGEPVLNIVFDTGTSAMWPVFGPRAAKEGFGGLNSLPLRLPDVVIGVMSIFHAHPCELTGRELELGRSLANLATVGVLRRRDTSPPVPVARELRAALDERRLIDHAKGFLAERLSVDVDTALALIRTYGHATGTRLGDLASTIVAARLAPEELLRGDHTAAAPPDSRAGHPVRARAG